MKIDQMVIYRNFKYQELFEQISRLLLEGKTDSDIPAECVPDPSRCAGQLINLAVTYGFEGNLWHCFLAFCLANHENAYSTSCEIVGTIDGTLNDFALHDMAILKELFDYDIASVDRIQGERCEELSAGVWEDMKAYHAASGNSRVFNKRIRDRIVELSVSLEQAENAEKFKAIVTEFYREFGVGKFGLNKAFRLDNKNEQTIIEPITNVEHVYLADLVGYELQKQKLIENTEAFIEGRAANNVLLYGDAGTGKSSSIKGILNEYYDRGLRIIEVYKHQFRMLSDVLEQVKDRNYRFIIYMDDLSFEEEELEYKYLKAIIEGGLGRRPKNVLIYATSNRRHLIREKFSDKEERDEELHVNDTVQEKLSLAYRFGVTIYYGSPDKRQFQHIVYSLAKRHGIKMPEEELLLEANKWELNHGGLSGRTANQFITHLVGMKNK